MDFLSKIHLDQLSFFLGVLTGGLLFWYLNRFKDLWPKVRQAVSQQTGKTKKSSAAVIEDRLRTEILNRAQGLHLTANMFSLDEIVVPPLLMAPIPQVSPDNPLMVDDVVTQTIQYTPDWPELAACYGSPTLDLYQPIQKGLNVVLIGQPGSGKSTALAYLASQVARRETPDPQLNTFLPVLIHVSDLLITPDTISDPWKLIDAWVVAHAPSQIQSKVPEMLAACQEEGRLLLLFDGLDELPAATVRDATAFLKSLIKQYPSLHVVVTASAEFIDGLIGIGLFPFALAGWGRSQVEAFINQWAKMWKEAIAPLAPTPGQLSAPNLDLIQHWLAADQAFQTPLEWTLIAWAAFAGDSLGPTLTDALDAFFDRLGIGKYRPAFEQLALQTILEARPGFQKAALEAALHQQKSVLAKTEPSEEDLLLERLDGTKRTIIPPEMDKSVDEWLHCGLFVERNGNLITFIHPLLTGFLAAPALAAATGGIEKLNIQQVWIGKSLALRFLGAIKEIPSVVDPYLRDGEPPLYRNLLIVARWIKDAPTTMKWRASVIQTLCELLLNDEIPMATRQRALSALVATRDQNLPLLFRQLIATNNPHSTLLAAIGLGALRDPRTVDDLVALTTHAAPTVRNAACLALSIIGNPPAIEAIAKVLIQADEGARRAAAESLANDPHQGYDVLKEGSTTGDILIRRAVIFGLARVHEPWALETLEKVRMEDGQWIVRNQATQIIDAIQGPSPYLPRLLPPPAQSPWLVEYAARQGIGIPGNSDARNLLFNIIKSGTEDEQLGALAYLRLMPDPDSIDAINHALWTGIGLTREAALYVLWEFAASGVSLNLSVDQKQESTSAGPASR